MEHPQAPSVPMAPGPPPAPDYNRLTPSQAEQQVQCTIINIFPSSDLCTVQYNQDISFISLWYSAV